MAPAPAGGSDRLAAACRDRSHRRCAVGAQARARLLGGVRVLDLTRVLAGPTCGKSLAEHGADVLKISAPISDSGLVELDTGIGKRSARLDLRSEPEVLRNLAREADVFIQSYRPGTLAARGFSPRPSPRRGPASCCLAQCVGRYGSVARAARIRQHRPGGAAA